MTASCAQNKDTKQWKLASKSSYKYGATKQKTSNMKMQNVLI